MKIAVAGTGYVGMSMATLLSERQSVVAVDIVPDKVDNTKCREIADYLVLHSRKIQMNISVYGESDTDDT